MEENLTPTSNTPFYHVILGVAIGAGGVMAGITLSSYAKKTTKKAKPKLKLNLNANSQPVLYTSPIQSSIIESMQEMSRLESNEALLATPLRRYHNISTLLEETLEETPPINALHQTTNLLATARGITTTSASKEQKKDGEILLGLLYNVGELQSRHDNVLHRGISCNICTANPLTGTRFKCLNCVDYDICSKCEPNAEHELTHVLMKISIPIPPLANPRTTLLPVLYPGKKVLSSTLPWSETLRLRELSHFDTSYIEVLYEQYKSLCTAKEGINKDTFHSCLGPLTSKKNLVVEQLFRFYDADNDGFINFDDFVNGMSILGKGNKKERMKYIFKGYDLDEDGFISKEDFQQMFQAYHQLSMELVRDVVRSCEEEMMATYDDSGNRPISAVFNAPIPDSSDNNTNNNTTTLWNKKLRTLSTSNSSSVDDFYVSIQPSTPKLVRSQLDNRLPAVEAMTQDAILELVDQIMLNADTDMDGKLSEKEFYNYALLDTSLLAWFEAIDTIF